MLDDRPLHDLICQASIVVRSIAAATPIIDDDDVSVDELVARRSMSSTGSRRPIRRKSRGAP